MSKKSTLLGMPHGTAYSRLRKSIIFTLAKRLELTKCYRCACEIETESEFSIDHKEAWEGSQDPLKTFLDPENIAFSHLKCNIGAAKRPNKIYATVAERKRVGFQGFYARNGDALNARRRAKRRKSSSRDVDIQQ